MKVLAWILFALLVGESLWKECSDLVKYANEKKLTTTMVVVWLAVLAGEIWAPFYLFQVRP